MASKFQKDLYRKRGTSFSMWDICVGLGLSLILTGLGLKAKDKYLPVRIGSRKEPTERPENTELPKEKRRSSRECNDRPSRECNDRPTANGDQSNALGKLGL